MDPIWAVSAGLVPYDEARRVQHAIAGARQAGEIPDVLLLLEHPPVYTKGKRASAEELPMGEDWYRMRGIEVTDTDRGGWTTYHGPGQLVAYPIVSLRPYGDDVGAYVRTMERVMIAALRVWGVETQVIDGLAGVWTLGAAPLEPGAIGPQGTPVGPASPGEGMARKIGSIGIHIDRGVTTHGLAINVNNDLQPFEWIVPCRIDAVRMTSLTRELGAEQDLGAFAQTLVEQWCEHYEREPVVRSLDDVLRPLALKTA
ncbi:MAG TPA: lipoyl(octanoyl) transferase LipB [Solirubrobacterales bacterium]|nr:lipoyl(octanoyl) transferase LipB [Solirubrobacterales bacterium]